MWSRYSLEKLTVPQTLKFFFLFYGIWRVISGVVAIDRRLFLLEPDDYSRRPSNRFLYIPLEYFPIYFKVFQVVYFIQGCLSKFCSISPSAQTCHTLHKFHPPRFHYQKIIWLFLHNMMLPIMPFSTVPCHFLSYIQTSSSSPYSGTSLAFASRPRTATDKTKYPYDGFMLLDRKEEDKMFWTEW